MNTDILGVSELKWTEIGEFISDEYYIYDCGQKSLIRNGVAITVNKKPKMQYLDAISKMTESVQFSSVQSLSRVRLFATP